MKKFRIDFDVFGNGKRQRDKSAKEQLAALNSEIDRLKKGWFIVAELGILKSHLCGNKFFFISLTRDFATVFVTNCASNSNTYQ